MMKKLLLILTTSLSILTLVGCGSQSEETPTPEPVDAFTSVVSVTGEVVPTKWADLSIQTGGTVAEVMVEPGDEVAAGDLLVGVDPTDAELAVQQAEAVLASAQAELARLKAQPRLEDVAAASEQVDSAEAELAQAVAERDRLAAGAISSDIAAAKAEIARAEAVRKEAQINFHDVRVKADNNKVEEWERAEAAMRFNAAEQALIAARKQLTQTLRGAGDRREEANAAVLAAEAQRDVAQARLDRLRVGATDEEIALAETDVAQAQVALDTAQVALERTELHAPFGGTIGEVNVRSGESVEAGQPAITLGDLSTLRVETTDLDEIDVARVEVGQSVDVTFDALPEKVFTGRVIRINPMAEPGGGGVNYTVVIEIDGLAPEIRWGMTAFVDIEVGE